MISRRPEVVWRAVFLGVGAWVVLGLCGSGQAQHTADPYNIVGEYNNQYEPYMYASYPTMPGTQPNQGRLDGRPGLRNANSFQEFLDSQEDEPGDLGRSASPLRSGAGTPYYRAYRRFDQEFQRTYRPNETADRNYYTDQEKRNDKYFQALREPDPRKRSQLLRDYNLDNMRSARDLSSGRNVNDKGRALERDRFSAGGASLYPEEPEPLVPPRPATTAPTPRAPFAPAPLPSPSARVRTGTGTPAPGSSLAPTAPRSGRTLAPAPPPRTGLSPAPSTSELLKRSELFDRAIRATAPVAPRTTAPPPR